MQLRHQRPPCLLGCSSQVPGAVLKHRHFLPNRSGGRKAPGKVLVDMVSGAPSLPGL